MPKVSVIMPVYNVERFVADAVSSVLAQSFEDFELLIVDDQSPDGSMDICKGFEDPRIRIIHHSRNKGLAGARNTGIRHARGEFLAFLDSDDSWHPDKLDRHLAHLDGRPEVGVSFSRSEFIDEYGNAMGCYQMPRLRDIEPGYYLCRNPIGNGSAPVIRRQVFMEIAYSDDFHGLTGNWYFDERFRRSEDIECWIRIALTTQWLIEGIPDPLTRYRLNAGGLSANLWKQLESWEQVIEKTRHYAPQFVAEWERPARAYQLRYLARQAIRLHDGKMAMQLVHRALATDLGIVRQEPIRSVLTVGAAYLLRLSPDHLYPLLEAMAKRLIGAAQAWRIGRDLNSQVG